MRLHVCILALAALVVQASAAFWMEEISHKGISPFNPDKSYQVFRNVKDFGAKGDGVTDDTMAINAAISFGHRCGGDSPCQGSTITPAVVYFPKGTYLVSSSIVSYYYTQMIGDPTSKPIIKATKDFKQRGIGLIEANPYQSNGRLKYGSTNTFFRQIRNFVLDMKEVEGAMAGIHWPSSQATSIQNVVFLMSNDPRRHHTGIFMEEGSGGLLNDLAFYGGEFGAQFGNQQYTARNLAFHGSQTAILQIWDWGWTYKSLSINNCKTGINMTSGSVGSVTLLDSDFNNVEVAILTGRDPRPRTGLKPGAQSLIIDNTEFKNVSTILKGPQGAVIEGTQATTVIKRAFGHGHLYAPFGPHIYQASDTTFRIPPALKAGNKYYERSKPQYESTPASSFLSARSYGAKGDGATDDTAALNRLFKEASQKFGEGAVAFLDAGYYRVTDTVFFPPNLRVVGEALSSVILAEGSRFSDINKPYPVVQVGKPGDKGYLEWSDCLVSTKGATAGAVLIEYNLETHIGSKCQISSPPSGIWDVHTRIGGFAGSELQVAQCPKTPDRANHINSRCIAAYMSCHITKSAAGLYIENSWFWVADHDIEDDSNTQITVFAGRGILIESTTGRIWLVGTGSEHHTLYQYQLVNTKDIWMGQIQTETAYYQPNPPAPYPFTNLNKTIHDPDFSLDCGGGAAGNATYGTNGTSQNQNAFALTYADLPGKPPCEMGWGLRILDSKNVMVYGAGLYSFFNNWKTDCVQEGFNKTLDSLEGKCQARMFYVGTASADSSASRSGESVSSNGKEVVIYNLNTVGVVSMINRQGTDVAYWKDNKAGFTDTVAMFKFHKDDTTGSGGGYDEGASEDSGDAYDSSADSSDSTGDRVAAPGFVDGAGKAIAGRAAFAGGAGHPMDKLKGFKHVEGEAGYVCFGDWQQLCGRAPQMGSDLGGFGRAPSPRMAAFTSSKAWDGASLRRAPEDDDVHPAAVERRQDGETTTVTVTSWVDCEPRYRTTLITVTETLRADATTSTGPPRPSETPHTTVPLFPGSNSSLTIIWHTPPPRQSSSSSSTEFMMAAGHVSAMAQPSFGEVPSVVGSVVALTISSSTPLTSLPLDSAMSTSDATALELSTSDATALELTSSPTPDAVASQPYDESEDDCEEAEATG